jgi:hypothetical protein
MTNSDASAAQFDVRPAQAADKQRIIDLFLAFPQYGKRRAIKGDTIVVYDENQELVGTCTLVIVHTAAQQLELLGADIPTATSSFPKLIVVNFCVASWRAEEALNLFNLREAYFLNALVEGVSEILHVLFPVDAAPWVSSVSSDKYEEIINEALDRQRKGEIPDFNWRPLVYPAIL